MGMLDIQLGSRLSVSAVTQTLTGWFAIQASWAINNPGLFTASIPYRDLANQGFAEPYKLKGKIIKYLHPQAGHWGGYVRQVLGNNGIITITGESWAGLMREVYIDGSKAPTGSDTVASTLSKIFLQTGGLGTALNSYPTISQDKSGVTEIFPVESEFFTNCLPAVTEYMLARPIGGFQPNGWYVDPQTRLWHIKNALGVVRNNITINDLYHVALVNWASFDRDIWNRLQFVYTSWETRQGQPIPGAFACSKRKYKTQKTCKQAGGSWGRAPSRPGQSITGPWYDNAVYAVNQTSIDQIGQVNFTYTEPKTIYYYSKAAAQARADFILANQQVYTNVSIELVNGPTSPVEATPLWSQFREGDTVPISLGISGKSGRMIIRERALDVDRDIMTIAGEAEVGL